VKFIVDRVFKIETIWDFSKSPTLKIKMTTPMPRRARSMRQKRVALWRIVGSGARLCLRMNFISMARMMSRQWTKQI
jgi:hypothetical protein